MGPEILVTYLVKEEEAGAREELVVGTEEGPPRQVGLEPAGPRLRVVCPRSVLQGLLWLGPQHPWTPGHEHLAPGGIDAGRPLPSP